VHLVTILAFVLLLWKPEVPPDWQLISPDNVVMTLVFAVIQPAMLGLIGLWVSLRTGRLIERFPKAPHRAQRFSHRATILLRILLLALFAVLIAATPWPQWFDWLERHPVIQIVGDLLTLLPFLAGAAVLLLAAYPLERRIHRDAIEWLEQFGHCVSGRGGLYGYLDFQIRHHVLVVAAPMTLILLAANVTQGYQSALQNALGWPWAAETVFGVVAILVFISAPLMLRHIWRTRSLEPGALRDRLEQLHKRAGLRCRDILVWEADGFMINAAVMGIIAPVRYVLLSDALLATMSPRQVEAVFGHEAGHVRYHHMSKLLGVAFVGWVLIAGLMELLARMSNNGTGGATITFGTIEAIGVVATVAFWSIGFGWVSRRFERQADLFGAKCVTPDASECTGPCSVHTVEESAGAGDGRVCSTAAALFASALDRVAALNGIPREEFSWRHSSIASRMHFLLSLARDPGEAEAFERMLHRLTVGIISAAVVGAAACLVYWACVPSPAILSM
jgi:STE24 endopeptidase